MESAQAGAGLLLPRMDSPAAENGKPLAGSFSRKEGRWRRMNMNTLSLDFTSARLARARRGPVRAGLIGCGDFGTGLLAQAASVPLLQISAAADHRLDAARQAYRQAGVPDEAVLACDSRRAALRAFETGKRVIAADPLLLMELPLEVLVEATGHPEGGARHAEAAIQHGKHVAMVNKEADVTVGPFLKRLADEAGVVYTAVDGDQHGLLIGLVAWARRLGMEVLCGGKSRDLDVDCDQLADTLRLTAQEARILDPLPWEQRTKDRAGMERQLEARSVCLGGLSRIGSWDLVELVIAANATGLIPDLPDGVHCPAVYAGEIPRALCPREMGGILRSRGVIDAVTCLRRPHETGLGGGVFVVVAAANEVAREALRGGGVCHNGEGTATLLTRPYHLLGIEAINSILAAALLGVGAGAVDYRPRWDVLARAAQDLEAGAVLGDDYSPDNEAFLGPAAPVADGQPLPKHLATGNRLVRSAARGTVITREMVAGPVDSALWTLRARQDACFFSNPGP
jgi:predicted homoserine dehydrogenase-like protein